MSRWGGFSASPLPPGGGRIGSVSLGGLSRLRPQSRPLTTHLAGRQPSHNAGKMGQGKRRPGSRTEAKRSPPDNSDLAECASPPLRPQGPPAALPFTTRPAPGRPRRSPLGFRANVFDLDVTAGRASPAMATQAAGQGTDSAPGPSETSGSTGGRGPACSLGPRKCLHDRASDWLLEFQPPSLAW